MIGSFSAAAATIIQRPPTSCFAASVRLGTMKRGGPGMAESWSDRHLASIGPGSKTRSGTH